MCLPESKLDFSLVRLCEESNRRGTTKQKVPFQGVTLYCEPCHVLLPFSSGGNLQKNDLTGSGIVKLP